MSFENQINDNTLPPQPAAIPPVRSETLLAVKCPHCDGLGFFQVEVLIGKYNYPRCGYCKGTGKTAPAAGKPSRETDVGRIKPHVCEEGDEPYCVHCRRWMGCDEETGDPIPEPNSTLHGSSEAKRKEIP